MLQLTEPAAILVDEWRREQRIPAHYGLRISGQQTSEGPRRLRLTFAEAPAATDIVYKQHGTALYVAEDVDPDVAEDALDVETPIEGNGASPPQLILRPQSSSGDVGPRG